MLKIRRHLGKKTLLLKKIVKQSKKKQSNVPWMPKGGWWSAYMLCIWDGLVGC